MTDFWDSFLKKTWHYRDLRDDLATIEVQIRGDNKQIALCNFTFANSNVLDFKVPFF